MWVTHHVPVHLHLVWLNTQTITLTSSVQQFLLCRPNVFRLNVFRRIRPNSLPSREHWMWWHWFAQRILRVLKDFCIQRSSNGTSHSRLPDMVTSHSTSVRQASIDIADSSAECCCSNRRHHRHQPQNRRRHPQHHRRQLTGSRDVDVVRGNRSSSPCCSSGCCCSDSGSTAEQLHRSAIWRASMTSSPDSLVDTATQHGGEGRYSAVSTSVCLFNDALFRNTFI